MFLHYNIREGLKSKHSVLNIDYKKKLQHLNVAHFKLVGHINGILFSLFRYFALLKMSLPLLGLLNGSIKKNEIFINLVNNSFK